MYNVQQLKNDLTGILHGTTTNQIQNLDGVINRAARQLLLDLDPQETKRIVEFVAPIFNSVYDYPLAADVKGNKIIDIFPQVQRYPWDVWTQAYNQAFDVWKQHIWGLANMFTINFNSSLKTLRVNAPYLNNPVIIDQIDAIAVNGTWAVGGKASNLSVNNTNFAQGAGSLQFDVEPTTSFAGPELLINGTFNGNANGWVLDTGATYGSNDVVFSLNPANVALQQNGLTINPTAAYRLTLDVVVNGGTIQPSLRDANSAGILFGNPIDTTGSYDYTIDLSIYNTLVPPIDTLQFTFVNDGYSGSITNISLKEVDLTNYIENSTLYPIDLSASENQSSFFTWVYVPVAADLTSVGLRIGSDATNYWEGTVTQTQQGTAFVNGWNLCQFQWASMTVNGTPDSSAISYARVTLNMTASATAVKVNGLNSILGTILAYEYYSKFLFRDAATGVYQETVTDDSNLINLDTESYNLLTNKVAEFAVQQQQGLDASFFDGAFFKNEYEQGVIRYKSMYKSELQKPQSAYYRVPNTSPSRSIGRGFGSN